MKRNEDRTLNGFQALKQDKDLTVWQAVQVTVAAFVAVMLFVGLLVESANASQYEMFYLSGSKRIEAVDANEALTDALKGQRVFKCQSVETKVSKSGTSISLRNVKKPKAVEVK